VRAFAAPTQRTANRRKFSCIFKQKKLPPRRGLADSAVRRRAPPPFLRRFAHKDYAWGRCFVRGCDGGAWNVVCRAREEDCPARILGGTMMA
jgi:hypothetical protein